MSEFYINYMPQHCVAVDVPCIVLFCCTYASKYYIQRGCICMHIYVSPFCHDLNSIQRLHSTISN